MGLTYFSKFGDSARLHPFGHVDVAIGCEAGIMGMDELAVFPGIRLSAMHLLVLDHVFDVGPKPRHQLISFIEMLVICLRSLTPFGQV